MHSRATDPECQSKRVRRSGWIVTRTKGSDNAIRAVLQPIEQTASPEKFRSQHSQPGKNHEPTRSRRDEKHHSNRQEGEADNHFDCTLNLSH